MPRLLLLDEQALVAEVGRSFLRRHGFEIVAAKNGEEMLRRAASEPHDLIFATASAPEMTVRDLCAALRASGAVSSIPILVAGPAGQQAEILAAGATAFLATPHTHRQMLAAIGSLLTVVERGANRVPVSVKVVCGEGTETYVAFTRDISATGLFLKGVSLSPTGTRLRLRLRIPGDTSQDDLDLPAVVVRRVSSNGDSGMGVRFLEIPVLRKVPINRLVREYSFD
jgi:CheY-like chemotaxis protein